MHLLGRTRRALATWAHTPPASSRHEIVLALAGASIMSGLGSLFGPDLRPQTISRFVPHNITVLWYFVLIVGGAGLILSAAWQNRLNSLVLEWPSWLMLGSSSLVYAICLIGPGRGTAFVATTGYLFYAVASLTRTARILLYINHLRREANRLHAVPDV